MKDLEKQIEEEGGIFPSEVDGKIGGWLIEKGFDDLVIEKRNPPCYTYVSDAIKLYLQESSRWRKVSEELPEVKVEDKSAHVLIKTKYGYYDVAIYNHTYKDFIANSIAITGVVEWKPIN